jgi:O-acetyl-ADP-ribose deacetylase (regulator of RNase III)
MKARHVIHTVGPVWQGGGGGEPELLASCYRESVRVAEELGLASLAFPSISTGIFGYPVELAAPVALRAVFDALKSAKHVRDVRFVLFDETTMQEYEQAAQVLSSQK